MGHCNAMHLPFVTCDELGVKHQVGLQSTTTPPLVQACCIPYIGFRLLLLLLMLKKTWHRHLVSLCGRAHGSLGLALPLMRNMANRHVRRRHDEH
jgi:hypothetical protein